jgi:hypothetical protein
LPVVIGEIGWPTNEHKTRPVVTSVFAWESIIPVQQCNGLSFMFKHLVLIPSIPFTSMWKK